ncbi:ABC transporter permease [Streptomyces mutabilis]|uniref:ABC transporter permease n=1 Tax=Streptomyces mutabilis TaxID=67332 RepID=UPI0022BA1AF8|nr:ABC transporter permease [Streptomyces mutabilis]MCZ9348234.1 ABC transporter permease [Streptomyces mutabilis]
MAGFGGLAGFVLLRARAHRLLLAAALLTVLLTTTVLATLTAFSGAVGDAALRHALTDPRNAADAALVVKADVPGARRSDADAAVREGAARTFDGLPHTVRTLVRSGPYALPPSPGSRTEGSGNPDLTYFAALDPTQVRIDRGRMPRGPAGGTVETALPLTAAERLGVRPGDRLALTDRLDGPAVRVVVTGLYRPVDGGAPYWRLDDLDGRGVEQGGFTTYGPLLAPSGVLSGGTVSAGPSGWLATADYSSLTAGRTDALRRAALQGTTWLRGRPVLSGTTEAGTGLPGILDRLDRSLVVARSTVLVIALQLAPLAGGALLLVARLLSVERAGELRLLRARGASRARLVGFSALEALLLVVPALVCAPLLAGPLTRLLAGQGPLARIGLRWESSAGGSGALWLVAALAALGCTLAVTLPALTSAAGPGGRARTLPAPLRAGADVALLVLAGVAYWQLDRQTSGWDAGTGSAAGGASATGVPDGTGGDPGTLGVDPLLVVTPALALLAGTALALRLLPLVARLAERRAASGRGLATALAGWQLSRRPMRGAGPVLLLVLSVALGTMAIGQSASWSRSQGDQADFRTGAPVRVTAPAESVPGRTDRYAAVPGVAEVAPAARTTMSLSGDRTATVLALDTSRVADTMLMRSDLAGEPLPDLLSGLAPGRPSAGARVPAGTAALSLTATLAGWDVGTPLGGPGDTGPGSGRSPAGMAADVAVTVEDRWGTPYRLRAGRLAADGREHTLTMDVSSGPLTLTGVELVMTRPTGDGEQHRLTVREVIATSADGTARRVRLPGDWTGRSEVTGPSLGPAEGAASAPPRVLRAQPFTVEYATGHSENDPTRPSSVLTLRLRVSGPRPPEVTAVATDRFLESTGARTGQRVDVTLGGERVRVRIARSVRELPTTAPETDPERFGGALLVDLRAVNRELQSAHGTGLAPTEWWLRTAPEEADGAVAALRAFPDTAPSQVLVRDEVAERLRDDPFGAGPGAAWAAAAGVAAALAAVGFAVSAAGSLRERGTEFAVLRALGASRPRLARTVAAEQGVLVGLALVTGAALGAVLTRAVIPLTVLTPQATRPVPGVHVTLPYDRVAVLLAATVLVPLLVTAALALRRADPTVTLKEHGGGWR